MRTRRQASSRENASQLRLKTEGLYHRSSFFTNEAYIAVARHTGAK